MAKKANPAPWASTPIDDLPPRQRAILAAAFAVLMEQGYAGAGTLEIATRAKVSKRELYAEFGSKRGILEALIASTAARMQHPLKPDDVRDRQTFVAALTRHGIASLSNREEFLEFGTHDVRQNNLLLPLVPIHAFEHAQSDATACATIGVEDVADVQREDLVFAKACAESDAVDNVISKAGGMFPRCAKKELLLLVRKRACGACDGVGVGSHGSSGVRGRSNQTGIRFRENQVQLWERR